MSNFNLEDLDATAEEWETFKKMLPGRMDTSSITKAREDFGKSGLLPTNKVEEGLTIREQLIPVTGSEIKVRIYTPTEGSGPFPLVMLFHGGGFCLGDLDTEDVGARRICVGANAVLVNVDYRLAPENQFPVPVNDCYDAMEWAIENATELNVDTSRIATTGTSAGGTLSLAVALKDRDCGHKRVTFVASIQPLTCHYDYYPKKYQEDLRSMTTHANADILDHKAARQFCSWYLGSNPKNSTHPYFSPLLASNLGELPPTYIAVGGQDLLRDEGIVMAKAIREAGVPCELDIYRGLPHGFMIFPLTASEQHFNRWIEQISNAFNKN